MRQTPKLKPVPARPQDLEQTTESLWALARLALGVASLGTAWLAKRGSGAADARQSGLPSSDHTVRYAMVGLMGELERLSSRASAELDHALRARPVQSPPARPGRRRAPVSPIGREMDRFEARGRLEIERMQERGRWELSRLVSAGQEQERTARIQTEGVLRDAISDVVEEVVQLSVVRVAESPAVREVIHAESAGLVEDLVDDVRGRLVRADALAEGALRRGLHLSPSPAALPTTSGEMVPGADRVADGEPVLPAVPAERLPAGLASRFAALAIDAWILTVGVASGAYLVSSALSFARLETSIRDSTTTALAYGGVLTLLVIAYLTVCWSAFGRTPGKALLGLKVVRRDGGELSVARSLLRVFGYFLSAVPLYLGFAWVLIDRNRLPWHDHIAGTAVVYVPRRYGRRQ